MVEEVGVWFGVPEGAGGVGTRELRAFVGVGLGHGVVFGGWNWVEGV